MQMSPEIIPCISSLLDLKYKHLISDCGVNPEAIFGMAKQTFLHSSLADFKS
jgi:hypothetical protein